MTRSWIEGSRKKVGPIFLCFLVVIMSVIVLGAQPAYADKPPPPPDSCGTNSQQPTYGTTNVDGDYSEWSLTNDFFANMYEAWSPDKPNPRLLSKLYLRYDCSTHGLYVLVLTENGISVDADVPEESWVKVALYPYEPNDYRKPTSLDFAWVGRNGDTATGWEASFELDPHWYRIRVHTSVDGGSTSGTSDDPCIYLMDCPTRGYIIVDKVTDPSADPTSFSFTTTGTGYVSFSLKDTSPRNNQLLNAGSYSVSETVPPAWDLTTLACTSSLGTSTTAITKPKADITLAAGDTVSCTFTDTKKNSPSISTLLSATQVPLGTPVTDTATLSGGTNPTGTITFYIYSAGDQTCSLDPIETFTVDVDKGNGDYTSPAFTPAGVGVYQWVASYSGDDNNSPVSSDCGEESLEVGGSVGTISTTLSASEVTVGTPVTDSATLSGATSDATGNIVFKVFSGSDTTCSGTVLFTSDEITVRGNGDYGPSTPSFTPSSVGTYRWQAFYSGDGKNNPATSSCELEILTVNQATPSIVTLVSSSPITLGGSASDTATLSNGVNPTGSITFTAYGPSDTASCSGTAAFTSVMDVNGNGQYTSGAFTPAAAGSYWWIASYSGDGNNNAMSTSCGDSGETLVVLENGRIVVDKVTAPSGDLTSFSFTTTGSGYNSFSLKDADPPNNQELKPGVVYSVQESPVPSEWTLAGLDCSSTTGDSTISTDVPTAKATITLAAGDTVTCTFRNEKSAGQTGALTVIKHVISDHAGMMEADDFTIHVMYYDAANEVWLEVPTSPQPGSETGTPYSGLNPGIYKVVEDEPPPLYVQVGITGDCAADGTVTVEANTNKVCKITNKDPALVVIKHVIGGSKSASDFIITVNGGNAIPATFPGSESGTRVVLDPGLYSVTETPIAGYSTTYSTDCSGTVVVDEPTKTCIITNEYPAGDGGTEPVGGDVYSVSKLGLLAPYLSLLGALGAAAMVIADRRRREL